MWEGTLCVHGLSTAIWIESAPEIFTSNECTGMVPEARKVAADVSLPR